ncbi:PAS domain-containing protein [Methanolacinia petrolearia]|uniref:PAS domain-containing protein n=1 Tax=Methanolacinia petrolearia TaxID=54120 RepID=UPI003BA85697
MGKKDAGPEENKRDKALNNLEYVFGEDFFKMLLMNSNVWISFIDPATRVVIWNSAAERMSGYSAEEVIGSNEIWTKLYPNPEYRKEITGKIGRIISNTLGLDKFETRIVRKDREKRIISWNTKEIRNDAEECEGYFIIGLDISDIIRAETGLKVLLMNANVFIIFLDREARIRIWNRFAEEISGYEAAEVIGSDEIWKKLYPDPMYRKQVKENVFGIFSDPQKREMFETEILTRSGEKKNVLWNTKMMYDYDRNLDGYVVIGLDITRKKEMQEEIFRYIGHSVMRLKYPVEIIRDNLYELHEKINVGDIGTEEILLELMIEIKNSEQILRNLQDLNRAVQNSFKEMPDELKDFLLQ